MYYRKQIESWSAKPTGNFNAYIFFCICHKKGGWVKIPIIILFNPTHPASNPIGWSVGWSSFSIVRSQNQDAKC